MKYIINTFNERDIKMELSEKNRIIDLVNKSVHSRFRPFSTAPGGGYITFYGKNNDSPTGVIRIGGCDATSENQELIRKMNSRISPLSATEGLKL